MGFANEQAIRLGQWSHQGAVLGRQRGHQGAVRPSLQNGPQIVGTLIVCRKIAAEPRIFGQVGYVLSPGERPY